MRRLHARLSTVVIRVPGYRSEPDTAAYPKAGLVLRGRADWLVEDVCNTHFANEIALDRARTERDT